MFEKELCCIFVLCSEIVKLVFSRLFLEVGYDVYGVVVYCMVGVLVIECIWCDVENGCINVILIMSGLVVE